MQAIIVKPWGREVLLTPPSLPYTAKILEIKAGCQLSLQYHDQKVETLTLATGEAEITLDDKTEKMEPKYGYTINVNITHRIKAKTDCMIFEASTPETGTTFRVEDDFDRPHETPDLRSTPNRGYQP